MSVLEVRGSFGAFQSLNKVNRELESFVSLGMRVFEVSLYSMWGKYTDFDFHFKVIRQKIWK